MEKLELQNVSSFFWAQTRRGPARTDVSSLQGSGLSVTATQGDALGYHMAPRWGLDGKFALTR